MTIDELRALMATEIERSRQIVAMNRETVAKAKKATWRAAMQGGRWAQADEPSAGPGGTIRDRMLALVRRLKARAATLMEMADSLPRGHPAELSRSLEYSNGQLDEILRMLQVGEGT